MTESESLTNSRRPMKKSSSSISEIATAPEPEPDPKLDEPAFPGDRLYVAEKMRERLDEEMKRGGWTIMWSERARLLLRVTLLQKSTGATVFITLDPEMTRCEFEREIAKINPTARPEPAEEREVATSRKPGKRVSNLR